MKKAWSIVLILVFIIILLGATAIGVGYFTGANLELVYSTMAQSPAATLVNTLLGYWDSAYAWAQQTIPALF